jgi:glutamate synthase (ferredoxin)
MHAMWWELSCSQIADAIENEKTVQKTVKIYNVDRSVGGRIAGAIAKKYGNTGFAGLLQLTFEGSAGQSFGCFLTPGMHIRLVGEANDYVAKVSLPECLVFTTLKCLSVDFQIQSCF